jgi:hypothetical protein
LHHQEDVEEYLAEQEVKSEALRQRIEVRYPTTEVRNRVLERWNKLQQDTNPSATPNQ